MTGDDLRAPERLRRRRKSFLVLGALYCGLGLVLIAIAWHGTDLLDSQSEGDFAALGLTMVVTGGLCMVLRDSIARGFRLIGQSSRTFSSIDDASVARRGRAMDAELVRLADQIALLESKLERGVEVVAAGEQSRPESTVATSTKSAYIAHFGQIEKTLLEKADAADSKASLLLDRGMSFAKWGLAFFIVSIIVWQSLAAFTGFKEQYVYGMVSCGVVFVFIEFLSSWCLRQYRAFVDTSTYLIKVKSIFDRHMLAYHLTMDGDPSAEEKRRGQLAVLRMLSADIRWPESYLGVRADPALARETLESLAQFVPRRGGGNGGRRRAGSAANGRDGGGQQ